MSAYMHDDSSDAVVSRGLDEAASRHPSSTAELLGYLASFETRGLYSPAGYSTMHSYCTEKLHFSDDAASRRMHAARVARKFPILFPALAAGKLHLTAITLLAPYLNSENVGELIEAATHKGKWEILQLIQERFPQPGFLAIGATLTPVRQDTSAPARIPESNGAGSAPARIHEQNGAVPMPTRSE